jgi:hypothetical protein
VFSAEPLSPYPTAPYPGDERLRVIDDCIKGPTGSCGPPLPRLAADVGDRPSGSASTVIDQQAR